MRGAIYVDLLTPTEIKILNNRDKFNVLNHFHDFPAYIKVDILYNADKWLTDLFSNKSKIKLHSYTHFWDNVSIDRFEYVKDNETADLLQEFFELHKFIVGEDFSDVVKQTIIRLLFNKSTSITDCVDIYKTLTLMVNKYKNDITSDNVSLLLFRLLKYKLDGLSIWLEITSEIHTTDSISIFNNKYFSMLLDWIFYSYKKCITKHINAYLNDVAIGIYLFLTELDINPIEWDSLFMYWLNEYSDIVHKKIIDLCNNPSDILDVIDRITDKNDFVKYFTEKEKTRLSNAKSTSKIVENLVNDKLSKEDSGQTLLFGENIISGIMSSRELTDKLTMLSTEYVSTYIEQYCDIPFTITFNLTEHSKMYLNDSKGVQLLTVYDKGEGKTICKYADEIYLLFEVISTTDSVHIDRIYGLSINSDKGNERKLLTIEKDNSYEYILVAGGVIK